MRYLIALAAASFVAATLVPAALAGSGGKVTLGPAGYDTHGNSTLAVAGTSAVLGTDDHVVICHAIGGATGSRFIQIAPSASGVVKGHGDHEGDRDIVPPYVFADRKGGQDTSLAAGKNWTTANASVYANGCGEPTKTIIPPTTTPQDVCPNIEGVQTSVPAGLTKDAAGNCSPPVVTIVPSPPVQQTITVEKVIVERVVVHVTMKPKAKAKVKKIKKAKKSKKVAKKKAKAKKAKRPKIQVKGARKAFPGRVLPHTP